MKYFLIQGKERHHQNTDVPLGIAQKLTPPPMPPKWVLIPNIKNADYRISTDDDNDGKIGNFDDNDDDGNFDENYDKITIEHSNNIYL